MSNLSTNPHINEIINNRYSRRFLLQGSLTAAAIGFFGASITACSSSNSSRTQSPNSPLDPAPESLLRFNAAPVSNSDTIVVPDGYSSNVLAPYGTPITGTYLEYMLENTGEDQGMQMGSHHDGMHFDPIDGNHPYEGSSEDGLLVMNHEYVEPRYMHVAAQGQRLSAPMYRYSTSIMNGTQTKFLKRSTATVWPSYVSLKVTTVPGRSCPTTATAVSRA